MRFRPSNLRFTICDSRAGQFERGPSQLIPSPVTLRPSRQSGVALIVTIIMISVITFLTIAFLALSGREKGAVKSATAQTTARLSADQALDRTKVELLTAILASGNVNNFDLLVSTNFINPNGFDTGAFDGLTNVNYDYLVGGGNLSLGQSRQNLANLLYDARPPVFRTNRSAANRQDFPFYLDLNRNGRHDPSGYAPVTNVNAGTPFAVVGTNGLFVTNYAVGDPEWIGGLERPGLPHSATNKFTHRYAYIAIPAGKTLDVNYIHNQALAASGGSMDAGGMDFSRNQGMAGWELNLAAFLYDLNTNDVHGWGGPPIPHPVFGSDLPGANAFADAAGIYRYRVNGSPTDLTYGLPSFNFLFGGNGTFAFANDLMDGYSSRAGDLFSTNGLGFVSAGYLTDTDISSQPWVGADHRFAHFTTQGLFDRSKTSTTGGGFKFADRLEMASTNISTYDRYTYYRLLAQLGTDSAPEDPDKLNLNYVNIGGLTATNFVPWTDPDLITGDALRGIPAFGGSLAVLFFTNAVDRLLRAYSTEWLASDRAVYTNLFKNDLIFGVTNIPVLVSNQFVYSPAVHRVLQVAANLWDTKPNGRTGQGLPTVFQPMFAVRDGNIYITNFVERSRADDMPADSILDILAITNNFAGVIPADGNVLIFGVPPVVGARKGLPNFNEFQTECLFTLTRKIQLRRAGGVIDQTNQFFTMSLSMPSAAEFWNSYATGYRPTPTDGVIVTVTNRTTMTLTNDFGVNYSTTFVTGDRFTTNNFWRPYRTVDPDKSLYVLMRTNVPFLPTVGYVPGTGFVSATNQNVYDVSQNLLLPRWGVTISNRVHAMILRQSDNSIIDYVLLGNMVYQANISDIIIDTAAGTGNAFEQLWATNNYAPNPALLSGRLGIEQQINISLGSAGNPPAEDEWRQFGTFAPSSPVNEIARFRNLYFDSGSNGLFNVPFTPTIQFRVPMVWQANDPLVHYNASDLLYLDESGKTFRIQPPKADSPGVLANIGAVNQRYKPWDVDSKTSPNARDLTLKDSLVTSSDQWLFPTNVLPTVGWLGRVHRGTPWQTIYLKSYDVGGLTNRVNSPLEWTDSAVFRPSADRWAQWTGNRNLWEGFYTRPVADRLLFEVFTTALNENATRGRLSVNQSGLAAWSALFSGMVALTNNSPDLTPGTTKPLYRPLVIEPAGVYDSQDPATWPALVRLVEGINRTRTNRTLFPRGTFETLGDILATPELTVASPFLNVKGEYIPTRAIPDSAYEWLPQQMMSLLQLGEPRFVVYAYGQALQPAPDSILVGGTYSGLCTNYAITAEVAARAVIRIEGSPDPNQTNPNLPAKKRYPPRIVVESYNLLPPD